MEQGKEHIDDLIARYSAQAITPEESEELLLWAKESEHNKMYFKQQVMLHRQVASQNVSFDSAKAHSQFDKSIQQTQTKVRRFSRTWLAAASIALAAILGGGVWYASQQPKVGIQLASKSEVSEFVLDDSSVVTLSRNTVIDKPQTFEKKAREVELSGKAFFKVTRDANRPFTVKAGNIYIKVLGTQFEVASNTFDSTVTVTVASGKVSVGYLTDKPSILTENQQIIITQQGKVLSRTVISNSNYLAWKTHIVVFDNTPMEEVALQLSDIYGKHFAIKDAKIFDKHFTSKIDNQSLSDVKFILSNALDIALEERGDSIIIKGRP